MAMGVYKIRNVANGKVYVGSSRNIQTRWRSHRSYLRRQRHHSIHLQMSWNTYGETGFVFEILEEVADIGSLVEREQWWIDQTRCYERDAGYNAARVAERPSIGRIVTEEERARVSMQFKGKKKSEEHRKRMSEGLKGRKRSEESRRKDSLSKKGKPLNLSEEQRRKLSESRRGRKLSLSPEQLEALGNRRRGRRHTEESNQKNREKHLGKRLSEEHRRKISEGVRGTKRTPEQCKTISDRCRGRKMSEEQKKKLSEIHKARWRNARQGSFQQGMLFDLNTD